MGVTVRSQNLEAIDVARRTGDHDLECDATASLGMMLVFSGRVDEGMAYLDEALAATCRSCRSSKAACAA